MNVADLRNKTEQELENDLISLREEQFKNNMQKATGQLENTHLIRLARRNVARIKTIINEKRNSK